jgi:hypothetical protein
MHLVGLKGPVLVVDTGISKVFGVSQAATTAGSSSQILEKGRTTTKEFSATLPLRKPVFEVQLKLNWNGCVL